MADYQSSLPVRSQADADERVQVKIVDATTVSQQMIVDTDSNAHVEVHGNNPAGVDEVLLLSELGAVVPDGIYNATNNSNPGNVGLIAHTRAVTPADAQQVQRLTGKNGTVDTDVWALDISLHDEAGNAYTPTNPLPVVVSESEGTEVFNYDTSASVAANATDNHDYVVAGSAFTFKKAIISGSGKMKAEIQVSDDGIAFSTVCVLFNSTANPNMEYEPTIGRVIPVTGAVRIIRTNRDNQAQDVYSTIVGFLA